jgi:hypothetical protein
MLGIVCPTGLERKSARSENVLFSGNPAGQPLGSFCQLSDHCAPRASKIPCSVLCVFWVVKILNILLSLAVENPGTVWIPGCILADKCASGTDCSDRTGEEVRQVFENVVLHFSRLG